MRCWAPRRRLASTGGNKAYACSPSSTAIFSLLPAPQHNNIAHRFWSIKGGAPAPSSGGGSPSAALEALLRAFSLLLPDQFNAFSVARYERGHHIAPHDDRAYTPVMLDSGGCRERVSQWLPPPLLAPSSSFP